MRVAEDAGVPVPVVPARGAPAAAAGPSRLRVPLVLKPARSAVSTVGVRKFGVTIVTDAEDLREAMRRYPAEAYPMLVQERIFGPGLVCFSSPGKAG